MDKQEFKRGDVVRLKNGSVVQIEYVKQQANTLMGSIDVAGYEVRNIKGLIETINPQDVAELVSLLQKIWFIIKGFFKKSA